MKLLTVLSCLAATAAAGIIPLAPSKPLFVPDASDFARQHEAKAHPSPVPLSACIYSCLFNKHSHAGCGRYNDWDCLCRSNGKLAKEVHNCIRSNCDQYEKVGIVNGIGSLYCKPLYDNIGPQ